MKYIKRIKDLNKGDLVFAKNEGKKGLIALVGCNPYEDEDYDDLMKVQLYFRGYNGDIIVWDDDMLHDDPLALVDMKENPDLVYLAHENGDIRAYESIAKKLGVRFDSRQYELEERVSLKEKNSIETLYKILDFCTYTNLIENVQISTSDTYVSFPADKLKLYDRGRYKYQLVGVAKMDFSFDVQPNNIDDIFSKDRSNFEVSLKDGTDIRFRFNKDIDMYIED